jgi:hypothetical protein
VYNNNNKKKKNVEAEWADPTIYLQFSISQPLYWSVLVANGLLWAARSWRWKISKNYTSSPHTWHLTCPVPITDKYSITN